MSSLICIILWFNKHVTVAQYMYRSRDEILWCPTFSWSFNDWELESIEHFSEILHFSHISRRGMDRIYWTLSKNHKFDVKSFHEDYSVDFPWQPIFLIGSLIFFDRSLFSLDFSS